MKTKRAPRLRHRPLCMEGLEQRAMLAGNVTAVVRSNTLFIVGDGADNSVSIQQTGINRFSISGSGTNINGRASAFVAANVRNLDINLRAGDDSIEIGNDLSYLGLLRVEASGGAQTPAGDVSAAVNVTGFAVVRTGDGNDVVAMQVRASAHVIIDTGAHTDFVAVEASSATHLHIQADADEVAARVGDDFVRVRGTAISRQAIVVVALAGDDRVIVDNVSAPAVILNPSVGGTAAGVTDVDTVIGVDVRGRNLVLAYGGVGEDTLDFSAVTNTHHLLLIGGADADVITVGQLDVNVATLLGEGGDDTVTLDDSLGIASAINIVLHIDTGAGDDTVDVSTAASAALNLAGNMNVVTGAGQDAVTLANFNLGGNLHIDLGIGDDGGGTNVGAGLILSDVDVAGFLHAFLGPGDDTLSATTTLSGHAEGALFFGGEADEDSGGDVFTNGGGLGVSGTDFTTFDFESEV